MTGIIENTTLFLIQTIFDLYITVLLLRLLLQLTGVSFYNPIAQLLLNITTPVLKPLQHVIPTVKHVDVATIVLIVLTEAIKVVLVVLLESGTFPNLIGVFVWAIAALCLQLVNIFFYGIIMQAVLSWISPGQNHPIYDVLYCLTKPVLSPIKRVLPLISGFDLSPIPALIGLKLIDILFIVPFVNLGVTWAMG